LDNHLRALVEAGTILPREAALVAMEPEKFRETIPGHEPEKVKA
jgi:hypothetical protein